MGLLFACFVNGDCKCCRLIYIKFNFDYSVIKSNEHVILGKF